MKQRLLLLVMFVIAVNGISNAQQAFQFSQYIFNGLTVNPAYAGYKGDWYVNSIYRKQWVDVTGAPESAVISFDGLTGVSNEKVGIGGQINYDKLGPQTAISFYGDFSYRIPLDDNNTKRLCLGLSFGATQYNLHGDVLTANDQNDPLVTASMQATYKPDARVGLYYFTPRFYFGASVLDLLSVYSGRGIYVSGGNTFYSIQRSANLYLNSGYLFKVSDKINFRPSVLIKDNFKAPTNLDLSAFLVWNDRFWLGGSYRTGIKIWKGSVTDNSLDAQDAVSAMAELFLSPRFRLGYAYDWMINGLGPYQQGSHEFSIGFTIPSKRKLTSEVSPRFF